MTDVREIASDLGAEQESLDALVADLEDERWALATPAPGWTVADQIGHLTYFDGAAVMAIRDPDTFRASAGELFATPERVEELTLHRHLRPPGLLDAWRGNRRRLADAAATLTEDDRIVWYGPSMGAKSFLTARLMECWAHGQDVADALGVVRRPTDRLRHIVRLGVITRAWSYANRGLEPPTGDVRVEVTAPSGEVWSFGPVDAGERIAGPALDFCLVVTQRRHVDDTLLTATGDAARDWLEKAQAFAGPATDGPRPRVA